MDTPSTLGTLHARLTAANITSDASPLARVEAIASADVQTLAALLDLFAEQRRFAAEPSVHVSRSDDRLSGRD